MKAASMFMPVLIESPFAPRLNAKDKAADRENNLVYARLAMRDCFNRGEMPFASHLLYTQPFVLNDEKADERKLGIDAGLAWGMFALKTVVYLDLGISKGMQQGIDAARDRRRLVEERTLPGDLFSIFMNHARVEA
jgi:hypothetical protein